MLLVGDDERTLNSDDTGDDDADGDAGVDEVDEVGAEQDGGGDELGGDEDGKDWR